MKKRGKVDELLGAQWGDEGKGKVVDVIAPEYSVVARFQGGPNSGHTLIFQGKKHVLHTVPSGIFHDGLINLIGNGVVIDPVALKKECDELGKLGIDVSRSLLISRKAHLILPTHRALDAASEADKGAGKIGSTLKGIGPTYMDKTGRNGFRVGDLESPDMMSRYQTLVKKHERLLGLYNEVIDWKSAEAEWLDALEFVRGLQVVDGEYWLDEQICSGKSVLAEGAQGTLLDVDFGTYPFVTSSNTIAAGACTGLGISPSRISSVIGIFKAYCTRVGSGPFPTELLDGTGERIRTVGAEFGSTTGRPRRCGWLDLPALRYAVMINGITELAMTKADVLDGMDEVKVCTHYRLSSQLTDRMPYDLSMVTEPVYQSMRGWDKLETKGHLSVPAIDFISMIEEYVGVRVSMVSTGPGPEDIRMGRQRAKGSLLGAAAEEQRHE